MKNSKLIEYQNRIGRQILTFIIVLSILVQGNVSLVMAQSPFITALPENDWVAGADWMPGETITLSIDDPNNGPGTDYSASEAITDDSFRFETGDFYDIKPGDIVTVHGSITNITKEHVVNHVAITHVDLNTQTVFGVASQNILVEVDIHNKDCFQDTLDITSDENGDWEADFTGLCEIEPGDHLGAKEWDDDGDYTMFGYSISFPFISVRPENDWVDGDEWIPGETITLSIDNPDNGSGIDYSTSEAIPDTSFRFQIGDFYDIEPDDIVMVYGDVSDITKEHIVNHVSITHVDLNAQTVFGVASQNILVEVDIHNKDCFQDTLDITSDENGDWEADFTGLCEIEPGDHLGAKEWDDDGDYTMFDYSIFIPSIYVDLHRNSIVDEDWPEDVTLTLSIDDPSNGPGEDYSAQIIAGQGETHPKGYLGFALYDQFQVQPGHIVTVSGGAFEITHIVKNLQFTRIDFEEDIVYGTCSPEATVMVQLDWIKGGRWVIVDMNGNWSADFSEYGDNSKEQFTFDLTPASRMLVACSIQTEAGLTEMKLPITSSAYLHGDVTGNNWTIGQPVVLEIDDLSTAESPDFTDQAWPEPRGWLTTEVHFSVAESIDIQPGFLVTMKQGEQVKNHIVTDIEITNINLDEDTVSGTAAPFACVTVDLDWGEKRSRTIQADSTGNWIADFSVPSGVPYEEIIDITTNTIIYAYEWDVQSNNTGIIRGWPWFYVNSTQQIIDAFDWSVGTVLTLTIDDPSTPMAPDYTDCTTVTNIDGEALGNFSLVDKIELQPGFVVTVSGEYVTKQLIIPELTITNIDIDADQVFGTASPGSPIGVLDISTEVARRYVTTDEDGYWMADFSVPGSSPQEQVVSDITLASSIFAYQFDDDWDVARVDWVSPTLLVQKTIDELDTILTDPDLDLAVAAAIEDALVDLEGANDGLGNNGVIDKIDGDQLNAALVKIERAIQDLEVAEAADPELDLSEIKEVLTLTAKSVALEVIDQAEAVASTPADLEKIDQANVLMAEGELLLEEGDYLGAVTKFQDALRCVQTLL